MNIAFFQKPSRYIGSEVNIIRKDAPIKIALCFPDTYEIGMSHLGLKILYSIINDIPNASAERVFAPWIDYEGYLRKNGSLLTSLENKRPLKDFDILGFSLQYELSYTNVLNMLELGGIPLRAEDRDDSHPLVIAGGPCTTNPAPLSPFIDAFVIGDGEDVIREIIDLYSRVKGQGSRGKREELLKELSMLEGVYVPSVHSNGHKIKRRIVEDLNSAPFPVKPVVPFSQVIHDRAVIEIARGCTRGCRFCHAGMIYRPLRERSLEKTLEIAQKTILNTGYEEISFTSLSAGDYSSLLPLIREFNSRFSCQNISTSLPSLRVGSINRDILEEIKSVRKTGFTIAPEAGTKKLRDIINKGMDEADYEEALEKLFSAGWDKIKLYFMVGLPTETDEDIEGIIRMAEYAYKKGKSITGSKVTINAGVSAFVPKPHTPFQWIGQTPFDELRRRQDYLRRTLKKKGINFKGQHVETSLLEAVLSRGDKTAASLIETAWRSGARFDGWSEVFNFDIWQKAAGETGVNLMEYASRSLNVNAELPWDNIDTGITKKFLIKEFQNALKAEATADCKLTCHGCGLGCKDSNKSQVTSNELENNSKLKIQNSKLGPTLSAIHQPLKIRVTFSKTGTLRYLSHLEVSRAILRALRRAEIPLSYSGGFHPHPKVSFGPALPVGVEGLNEYFDMETHQLLEISTILEKINSTMPEGLMIVKTERIPYTKKIADETANRYRYEITINDDMKGTVSKIDFRLLHDFIQSSEHLMSRDGKIIDIRQMVEEAKLEKNKLSLLLKDTDKAKVRLYEILGEMFKLPAERLYELNIKRTDIAAVNTNTGSEPITANNW
ncbi:MAG: TIGR03960 family B12-binding radical SAM protein [Nitrospirae bacterium]|nr:TIGR03960 family B12-binding radical SAM protein [Nitrospirota bacterium]